MHLRTVALKTNAGGAPYRLVHQQIINTLYPGKMSYPLILFCLLSICSENLTPVPAAHPLKMTISRLTVDEGGGAYLRTRFFLDDLTSHLQETYGLQAVDFSSPASNGGRALQDYLNQTVFLGSAADPIRFRIDTIMPILPGAIAVETGMQADRALSPGQPIVLTNTLLVEVFLQQVNRVRFRNQSYLFSVREKTLTLND